MNIVLIDKYKLYFINNKLFGIYLKEDNKFSNNLITDILEKKYQNQFMFYSKKNINDNNEKIISGLTVINTMLLSSILIFGFKNYKQSPYEYKVISAGEGKKIVQEINATKSDLINAIDYNKLIDDKLKDKVKSFIKYVEKYYPDTNLDKFYYNLKDLEIDYKDSLSSFNKNDDITVKGFYNLINNKIEILNNLSDTEEINVLYHELVHACTECKYDDKIIKYNSGKGSGALEMFCEYFSSREPGNLSTGYSWLPYAECIVALTDYSFDDYCNGGIELLEKKLDSNGLNGEEIIKFLDDLKDNTTGDEENLYSINYQDELQNICYRKVISKFEKSPYDTMEEYIESVEENIPGSASDFRNWIGLSLTVAESTKEKINTNYFKDSIKKNILFDLGIIDVGAYVNLDEYDIERFNDSDNWILTRNDDIIMESFDKMKDYNKYLNNPKDYGKLGREELNKSMYEKTEILFSDYISKVSSVLENDFKNKYHVKNDIKLVWDYDEGMYYSSGKKIIDISKYEDLSLEDNNYNLFFSLNAGIHNDIFNNNFYCNYNTLHSNIDDIDSDILGKYPLYNLVNDKVYKK